MKKKALIVSIITTITVIFANCIPLVLSLGLSITAPLDKAINGNYTTAQGSLFTLIPAASAQVALILSLVLSILAYAKSERRSFGKYNAFRTIVCILTFIASLITLHGAIWFQNMCSAEVVLDDYVLILSITGIALAIVHTVISIIDIVKSKNETVA